MPIVCFDNFHGALLTPPHVHDPTELTKQVEDAHAKSIYPNREGAHTELVMQLQHTLQQARAAVEQLNGESR